MEQNENIVVEEVSLKDRVKAGVDAINENKYVKIGKKILPYIVGAASGAGLTLLLVKTASKIAIESDEDDIYEEETDVTE